LNVKRLLPLATLAIAWCLACAPAQAKMAACAEKNALWGKFLEASGRKLSEAPPARDFAVESGCYGYETAMGRACWPSPDPIGEEGGENLYNFALNNPVKWIDFLGLDWAEYSGETVTIYGGSPPDRSKVIKKCPAASGLPGSQKPSDQSKKDSGPTPEGKYTIDMRPDANRTAPLNPDTGDLRMPKGGGIDKIPNPGKTPDGQEFTYPGWGKNRALLEPDKGTDTMGRTSIYTHDSEKGFSHGCIECKELMDHILKLKKEGKQKEFPVEVKYTDPTTAGKTKAP